VEIDGFELRVGTDVNRSPRWLSPIAHFGDRYVRRLYTDHEVECCGGVRVESAPGLAARFAAKEATNQAAPVDRRTIRGGDPSRSGAGPAGGVDLSLSDGAQRLAEEAGVRHLSMSMSHGAGGGDRHRGGTLPGRSEVVSPAEAEVRRLLEVHGGLPVEAATLDGEADLFDLGMTSHASVNVMLALEDSFDIEFPDEMLRKSTFESVNAISAALGELGAQAPIS